MCEHFLNLTNSCCVIVGRPKFLSVRVAGIPAGIVVFPACQTGLGSKIDRDYKFRVPISGIQSLGFDLSFIYKFKICLDFFLSYALGPAGPLLSCHQLKQWCTSWAHHAARRYVQEAPSQQKIHPGLR